MKRNRSRKANLYFAVITLILLGSFLLRLYRLNLPNEKVFDEVYFPVFAANYLTQSDFYDAHPPLGKLFIASSIALWGDNPLGWRFVNSLAGVALIVTVLGLTYDLTRRWPAAIMAMALVAIEPMALVESRIGLINIYLALFSLLGFWAFWRWIKTARAGPLAAAMIFFGAAAAVKWIGLGAAVAAGLYWVLARTVAKGKLPLPSPSPWQLIFIALIPLVYSLTFVPDLLRGQDFWWWHQSTFSYHARLDATHPYGSPWWSWALMLRPIWLYYQVNPPGTVTGIIELGNVVTWLGGLIALAMIIGRAFGSPRPSERKRRDLFLIIIYLALYLPWMVISRVKFIYHYFVPALILLVIVAIVLDEIILPRSRWLGASFLILAVAFFLYFLPLTIGLPVSESFYRQHMWLRSWI